MREAGADIIPGDLEGLDAIKEHLHGVDTLILTIIPMTPGLQEALLIEAKNAGVKRVVPSDFGPTAPAGVMMLHDGVSVTAFHRLDPFPLLSITKEASDAQVYQG